MNMNVAKIELVLPFIVVIVSCLLMHTRSQQHILDQHIAFFIFGDSFFEVGNNNYINTTTEYQANFWPYGESYFNPPTGRNSNGRIIPDFIAEYAKLPLIPAYLDPSLKNVDFVYGANFASGGAGTLVETNAGYVIDLKTQLQYFGDLATQFRQNLGDEKARELLSNAVYLFTCSGNDYHPNNDNLRDLYTHEQFVEMVLGNLTDVFKGIHEKGGRKLATFTLPPLACEPAIRIGDTCNEEIYFISILHNQKLSSKLKELETQLEGFMYAIFDIYNAMSDRMNNPSKYGFKVGDTACCGSGPSRGINTCGGKRSGGQEYELCDNVNDYIFFDAFHPTEVAFRQLAELCWNGDSNVMAPYNLRAFFEGRNPDLSLSSV